jgi:hypothetical protein
VIGKVRTSGAGEATSRDGRIPRHLGRSTRGSDLLGGGEPDLILQAFRQGVEYQTDQIVPIILLQCTSLGLAVLSTSALNTLAEL